jgi:hypothetical protein
MTPKQNTAFARVSKKTRAADRMNVAVRGLLFMSAVGGKADIAVQACAVSISQFLKDLSGRLHGGYIAASSLPSR